MKANKPFKPMINSNDRIFFRVEIIFLPKIKRNCFHCLVGSHSNIKLTLGKVNFVNKIRIDKEIFTRKKSDLNQTKVKKKTLHRCNLGDEQNRTVMFLV